MHIALLYTLRRAHTHGVCAMCKAYQNSNALDVDVDGDSDSDANVGDSDSGSSAFKLNVKLIARVDKSFE